MIFIFENNEIPNLDLSFLSIVIVSNSLTFLLLIKASTSNLVPIVELKL